MDLLGMIREVNTIKRLLDRGRMRLYEKPYLDADYETGRGIEEENLTIAAIKRKKS